MLDYFLENTTKKKLYLFSILYLKRVTSVKECKYILTFSSTSIISIINELNFDFNGIAEINITNSLELKLIVYEDITFSDLLHAIYQSSNVLHCIKFMITNESNHSFWYLRKITILQNPVHIEYDKNVLNISAVSVWILKK